ncbi:hypothetical protein ACH4T9_12795 [Micromonospora sp. NPDC020750]|uniref:hypothetical protein n=1 Tax=unclassified Micromonospora TaxID=2617518 RepID=UPI0037B7861F
MDFNANPACPVHVVRIVGCPHPNPADIYRDDTRKQVTDYLHRLGVSHPHASVDQAIRLLPAGLRSNLAEQYAREQFTADPETKPCVSGVPDADRFEIVETGRG